MLTVGLTGGFGSGKSFVALLFKGFGADIVDADKLGRAALKRGSPAYKKVVASFGREILKPDLSIDRRALAKLVFSDKKSLTKLNSIVHPIIIRDIKKEIGRRGRVGIIVVDAPLICEADIKGLMDVLIVVKVSRKKQIERSAGKFDISPADARRRIACQMPLSAKLKAADYVIDNNGTKEETVKQAIDIWRRIKRGARLWR